MKRAMLTTGRAGATPAAMRSNPPTRLCLIAPAAAALLGGCISVKAPEKPIEINLNVTIRQEVVVSLRRDVADLDKQYPGVF